MTRPHQTLENEATTIVYKGVKFIPVGLPNAGLMPNADQMQAIVDSIAYFEGTLSVPDHVHCCVMGDGSQSRKLIDIPVENKDFDLTCDQYRALSNKGFVASDELRKRLTSYDGGMAPCKVSGSYVLLFKL